MRNMIFKHDPNFPSVTIVVPVYNGEENIENCIKSLLNQKYPKENLEIIIVDNNSTDNTAEIIKRYPVKYLAEIKQGVCYARNRGLKEATGDLLAYTDSDCIADENWIAMLASNFKSSSIGGVGGHLASVESDNLIEKYIAHREILTQEKMFQDKPFSPPFFITANVMYRTEALKKIGGFDNFFTISGEDADLAWRVVDEGYSLLLEEKAIVYHKHRANLKKFCKQMFGYGIGSAAIFKKYRHRFGATLWFDYMAYINIIKSLYHLPKYYFFKNDSLSRYVFLIDIINNLSFITGKIYGSIKYKTIVF